ncbi:SRPBCC family protein [Streptomyces sp. ISL-44]|uniref:type II toxin-antitoxin system Rv0910 family toxin n=1 Tax=unclassified Streptomyces TaxID=2593676 RepID=UPI001BEC4132|nr:MULTISPECIES: SRPBCC family protein [unclassified Streptomyces]MBT2545977.1 SRPBCC family protein [Streptomyces sp. ISL-44]MCX5016204.1 SRPBCC family protein [Streptomyces sp. NBC_00555]MCX5609166.1 SRPBCC family protein [Streptomyces sp. NBC_00047]UUU43104.1 SRPBCC family protein [Streptomyces sp. NBC_00162]
MAEVTAESRIEASAAKLWSQLTDWDAYGQWSMTHTNFPKGGPETLAVGSTFAENMKMMGFPAEVVWTVSELEDERVFAITGKGPMGVAVLTRYTLVPDGGATTVRIDGEFTGAAVSLMAGKLKDSATAALNESLRKLAGLVA